MKRLLARADFDAAIAQGAAIVVTDSATGTRIHQPPCPWVKATYFEMKVITGNGKNGAYYAFATVAAAVASFGDKRCPRCTHALGARATILTDILPLGHKAPHHPATIENDVKYVVKRAADNGGVVEAWSQDRLNYQPKDWREQFRLELKDAVAALEGGKSRVLHAAFTSPEKGTFDIENILFFNLEREWNAGADCFGQCASTRVVFERSFGMPPAAPGGRTFLHYHRYEVKRSNCGPSLWKNGRILVSWKGVSSGPPSAWERGAHVWRWMRRADLEFLATPGPCPAAIGVTLTLSGPEDPLNLLKVVKTGLDGVILAFQVDDGRSAQAGIEKHASNAGLSVDEVVHLLRDGSRAVLGKDRLLLKNGQMNPCDDKCVAIDLRRGPIADNWVLSGELYEAAPVAD
jgi:hypothetical protein